MKSFELMLVFWGNVLFKKVEGALHMFPETIKHFTTMMQNTLFLYTLPVLTSEANFWNVNQKHNSWKH